MIPIHHLPRINASNQKGAALIMLFLAIIMAASLYFISSLSSITSQSSREQVTTNALSKAKQALLAYAVSYYEKAGFEGRYGFLPCPGSSVGEGNETGNCAAKYDHHLGRLPWKTLDIEPLRDAAGECLWYAVSGVYKNGSSIEADMHNEDSVGMFELYDENSNPLKAGAAANRVVAVVIAPGAVLSASGQTRQPADPNLFCKVADDVVTATDYLEAVGVYDNASFDSPQNLDTFVTARSQQNQNINDRIITITQEEIFSAIRKSRVFLDRANASTESLAQCVNEYIATNPAVTGGGCDLAVCLQQCADDQTTCRNACDDCSNQCDLDYDACIAAGTRRNTCNSLRRACDNACPSRRACSRRTCSRAFRTCETGCNTNCTAGGGGGGGGNNFWLPWPAPVTLSAVINDYRLNSVYDDASANQTPGRLPETIDNSNTATGNSTADLFANCSAIMPTLNAFPSLPPTIDYTDDANDEYKILWRHWKDHFFYVIGSGFEPSNAPATGTPNCATTPASCVEVITGGVSSYYAAIVIYSGTATEVQSRDLDKGIYTNYLESYDIANNRFSFSSGQPSDDVAYCISDQRVITKCSP